MSQRDKLIFVCIFSFILGILISSFVTIMPLVAVFLVLLAILALLAEKVWNHTVGFEAVLICVALASLALGSLRYAIKDFHEDTVPGSVGIVADEPEHRDADTRFVLQTEVGKVLVSTDMYSPVEYGDEIRVSGKLKTPGVIADTAGSDFDYGAYLAREDVYYTESFAKIEILSHGHGNRIKAFLLDIKHDFIRKMRDILPEPESSLLAGLIVAGKEALPKSVLNDFVRAGVVHIVVLSGYNITLVAEFLRRLFAGLSTRAAGIASVAGIAVFVLMAGGTPSIVRAALMALIAVGGKLLRRQYHVGRALAAAAFIMLLINPKILVFDPSFQLSFLATLGMVYGTPILEKCLQKIPEKFGLRGLLSVTVATQLFVMPFLLYSMGAVSVVSLITNILILPLVPATMLMGFAATLLAFISTYFALPLTYATHLLLVWSLGVARYLGSLPFAQIQARLPLGGALLCYLIFLALYRFLGQKAAGLEVPQALV